MFKKKNAQQENKMTYFLGGTAVGMAAGLLFRKLFSNSSGGHTRNPESDAYTNKNGNTYSQDDNIHNLHIKRSTASGRTRSKSASQYEEMNMNNNSVERTVPLNKFDKDLKCNAANLDINYKCDKNIPKYFYNNKDNTLYNISMESNIEHNLHSKILSEDCEDKNNIDNNEISKPEGTKREPEDNGSMKNDNLIKEINIQGTNDNNNNKETTQKQIEAADHIELTDAFNSLSNDFCENFTSNINLENVNNSRTFNPNILLDYGDNLSNNPTYNNSASLNNEADTNRLNSCYSDEFHETDLMSSTKQDNVEKI